MKFVTTHWSLVMAAGSGTPEGRTALNQLLQNHWRPLFFYLRQRGYSWHDAEDLTQQFLSELLARDGLARVHPRHGRFRSFLLASLRNFLGHQREKAAAAKRGGGRPAVSLDAPAWGQTPEPAAPDEPPTAAFDRQWGLHVLDRARQRLEGEYMAAGKKARFELLVEYLPGGKPAHCQAELAERLGTTVSAIKSEAWRLRQRFGQYLRAEIADTVDGPAEIDDEIRYLVGLFSSHPRP